MSNGNNYLLIPSEAHLSTKSAEETDNAAMDDEDDLECYTLVPRSSPVPRRRGLSIFDETAEYMRTRLSLPSRRVSFVDSQGGELVEVKEFVAFDSDEEEDPRWEIEDARYRRATKEPIYQLCPDFEVPTDSALRLALQKNKIEIESLSLGEHDPLSFVGLIRVLNICFNKSVYVRFTMDGWSTYFDCPADYVMGSNDVETDQYSFKLSFAGPYTTHGCKIEFVLRYDTPGGDYWANNGGKNYAVVLNVSYMDGTGPGNSMDDRQLRSILKPARIGDDPEEALAADSEEEDARGTEPEPAAPKRAPAVPRVAHPKIDIENKDAGPSSPSETDTDHGIVDSVPQECASEPPSETPLSFSAVEQDPASKAIIGQPLATQPRPESPPEADFTECDLVVKEPNEDTGIYAHDTETVEVSESHVICQTATPEQALPPHDEVGYEKDQDAPEGESDSEPPHIIQEPPLSIPIPSEDLDAELEMELEDQINKDIEAYLRYTEAYGKSPGLESDIQETGEPEELSETDPEGELSVPGAAVTLSGEAGFESSSPEGPVSVPYPPLLHFLPDELDTEFDELLVSTAFGPDPAEYLLESLEAPEEEIGYMSLDTVGEITAPPDTADPDVVAPSASHTYSHVPDQEVWEELAEEYSCSTLDPSDSAPQELESLVEDDVVHREAAEPVVSLSEAVISNGAPQCLESLVEEQVVHQQAAEPAVSQSEAVISNGAPQCLESLVAEQVVHRQATEPAVLQSDLVTSNGAPQGLEGLGEEEVAEPVVPLSNDGTSNSAPQSLEGLEQEEVDHQEAAELASSLRLAYAASSVFLTVSFCLVLAYHDPQILPVVLFYLICL